MDSILSKNIIDILGIGALSEEKQEKIFLEVGQIIFQGVLIRVIDSLGDEDKDQLSMMLNKNKSADDVAGFLQQKIPDFENILQEEIIKFKNDSLDLMGDL